MRTHPAVPRRAARLSRLPLGVASLLAFALTCRDVTVTPVAVRNVEVDPADVTLTVGEERQLTAIVTDDAGHPLDRSVTWSAEDDDIVSVDAETGDVVALRSGETSVTAAVDGRSGTATVIVMDAPEEKVATVEIDPDTARIAIGQTVALEAIARSDGGAVLSGREVSWSSTDEETATVDGEGVVTGVAAGDATITATIEGISDSAQVTVSRTTVDSVVVVPPEPSVLIGDTVRLAAIALAANGDTLADRAASWESADPTIATVDDEGLVTGVAEGGVEIRATVEDVSGSTQVTVSLVPVESVEVVPDETTILVGDTLRLTATALAANGDTLSGRAASWESNDPSVATVDGNGLVTGVAEGVADVMVTIEGATETSEVTVSIAPVVSVEVVPVGASVFVGDTLRLTAIALAANGDTLTGRTATWESHDSDIATVDDHGLVTGVAEGVADITATIEHAAETVELTVSLVPVDSVEVDPAEATIEVDGTVALEAIARSDDGTVLEGRAVTWSSSDAAVASVDAAGVVTGVAEGAATIMATIENVEGNAQITVSPVPVAMVEVDPAEASIEVGSTVALEAIALSDDDTVLEGREATWSSSDPTVASVDEDGVVTGVAEGAAAISATIENVEGNAQITVSPVPVATVEVDPAEASLEVGGSVALEAIALSDDDTVLEGREATWSSSDPTVASVDAAGVVTGVAEGAATVKATIEGVEGNAQITVSPVPVVTVVVDPDEASIFTGQTVQLSAIPLAANGDTLQGRAVTWMSDNIPVATVDQNGLVTAGLPLGFATIRATIEGVSGSATITVLLIRVESVELEPAEASIVLGETVQLMARALSESGDVIEGHPVSWQSDNVSVATVDAVGLVKGEAPGEAAIMATIEDKSDIARILVDPVPVESIIVSPASVSMNILSPVNPTVFTAEVSGRNIPLPGRLITWGVTSASGLEPCPGVSSSTNASVTLTPLSGTTDIDGRSQTTATVNVLPLPDPGTAVVYATAEGEVGCATIEVSIL